MTELKKNLENYVVQKNGLYNTFLNLNLVRRDINTQAISTRLSILLIMHLQVLVRTTSTRVSDLGRFDMSLRSVITSNHR